MKLFIWHDVAEATDHYHHSGGIVVVADSLERARELIAVGTQSTWKIDKKPCEALIKEPDIIRECEGPELFAVHADEGCC